MHLTYIFQFTYLGVFKLKNQIFLIKGYFSKVLQRPVCRRDVLVLEH